MPKVQLKKTKSDPAKDVVVGINSKEDYIAVKGIGKSSFNGVTKVLHKVAGQKLIDKGFAEAVKTEFSVTPNSNRTSVDIEENK